MNPIKIEVGQYRAMEKGSLKAFFSLIIHPQGEKILDCRYFVMDDKRWFSFPQKEIKYTDGRKTEYIPYISYMNKDYLEQLKIAVLVALKEKESKPQESHAKPKSNSYQSHKSEVPFEPSSDFGELPF